MIVGVAIGARIAGVGTFDPYPVIELDADAATIALAAVLPALAAAPYVGLGRRARGR